MKKKRQMSTAGKNRLSTEQHLAGWEHVGRVLLKGNILATLKQNFDKDMMNHNKSTMMATAMAYPDVFTVSSQGFLTDSRGCTNQQTPQPY